MQRISSPTGATVSYERYGSGPPLVLVHGGFSDHHTNWEFVRPSFETAVQRLRNRPPRPGGNGRDRRPQPGG